LLDLGISVIEKIERMLENLPLCKRFLNTHIWLEYTLQAIHSQNLCQKWKQLLSQPNPPLEMGAIIIGQWKSPYLDPCDIIQTLDVMGSELKRLLEVKRPSNTKDLFIVVNHYFFDVQKFRPGTLTMKTFVQDSLIQHVLAAKTGIPISLSVVYHAICRRVGIHINIVNMPQRVLLYYENKEEKLFIDLFEYGKILNIEDVNIRILSYRLRISDLFLYKAVLPPAEVWARMLRNLVHIVGQERVNGVSIRDVLSSFGLFDQCECFGSCDANLHAPILDTTINDKIYFGAYEAARKLVDSYSISPFYQSTALKKITARKAEHIAFWQKTRSKGGLKIEDDEKLMSLCETVDVLKSHPKWKYFDAFVFDGYVPIWKEKGKV